MTKKIIFLVLVVTILKGQMALSQNTEHHVGGGHFTKRIEYNVNVKGTQGFDNSYNLNSKSILDRILFGSINSPVEFVFEDSPEGDDEVLALRIAKNFPTGSYQLEIMQISDIQKMDNAINFISTKVNKIDIPSEFFKTISMEGRDMILEHNREVNRIKLSDDLYKPYRPKSKKFNIKNEFAEKLHDKMAALISNFEAKGVPPIISDGYSVTFRTVVDDEVWSLWIHMPKGDALKMSDFCRQIIKDVETNNFNESKYIELLDNVMK
ncbi:hypothetical protein FACS189430_08860 [Bacteroidia bacterium]|nr:hypothetical protein FACS189430_08860 [Bacteroidia bacterium]